MSLACSADTEGEGTLDLHFTQEALLDFTCLECRQLVASGSTSYEVVRTDYGDYGEEEYSTEGHVCEACGDLALSWFEQGFCWEYRQLRNDIQEANGEGMI